MKAQESVDRGELVCDQIVTDRIVIDQIVIDVILQRVREPDREADVMFGGFPGRATRRKPCPRRSAPRARS